MRSDHPSQAEYQRGLDDIAEETMENARVTIPRAILEDVKAVIEHGDEMDEEYGPAVDRILNAIDFALSNG